MKYRVLLATIGSGVALSLYPLPSQANQALTTEVTIAPARVTQAGSRPLTLVAGSRKWTVPAATVKTWFRTRTSNGTTYVQLRPNVIYDYLNIHVSPRVNDLGENSRFIGSGATTQLIKGGRKGQIVDGVKTSLAIRRALVDGASSVTVSTKEYRPAIFSVADFKKLSFPALLGRGESSFAGSPRNRIHNIHVATARYNGLVIPAGEEFSFNQYLGSVDKANGYLPELVIKENVTTPEYGGGICQVSTTVFRAAMIAGLDVTARRNHSYPVRYYGTPGFDATVYQPAPDFRFRNDTPHPILLKTSIQGTKVVFEVFGKSDGRTTKINGPFVTARKPDGSLTAAVAQIVTRGGKVLREENFVSKYQPESKFPQVRAANGE